MEKKNIPGDLVRRIDVAAAIGLLTRLPVRVDGATASARGARAAWAYPLVGAMLGALAFGVAALALRLGTSPGIAAALALGAQFAATGAMHEDGLADSADGLWGGWTRERRLEIMKDSRIGTYGVLALILSLLLRWSALEALAGSGALAGALIAAGALSRGLMVGLWGRLPSARPAGLAAAVGQPGAATCLLGLAVATGLGLICLGPVATALCLFAGGIAVAGLGRTALRRIGGQTGDILGAGQQIAEIVILIALAARLA